MQQQLQEKYAVYSMCAFRSLLYQQSKTHGSIPGLHSQLWQRKYWLVIEGEELG